MSRNPGSLSRVIGFTGCLLGVCLMFCNPVASNQAEEKSGKVKELEQKRLAVLEKILNLAKKGFTDGLISHEQLRTAKTDFLSAKLEYADTKTERIKACDEAVADAKEWQKIVQDGVKAQVYSRIDELKAESDLLEAQITREKTNDED